MNKNEYILNLDAFINKSGITVYEYYYSLAKRLRSSSAYNFAKWEMECPFLNAVDYDKLISSNDQDIEKYFALAMEKVIYLNKNTALTPVANKNTEVAVQANKNLKTTENNGITKSDISDVLNEEFDELERNISREDIRDVLNSKFDELQDSLSREDISSAIDEEFDSLKEGISRDDISSVLGEKFDEINGVSRSDIYDVISNEMDALEGKVSRDDISSVINEEYSRISKIGTYISSISRKISRFLNGFTAAKNDNKVILYYHDANRGELRGRREYSADRLKIDSGYYVNYQEYLNSMLDNLMDKFPNMESVSFIDNDDNELTLNELANNAFNVLLKAGTIKFGSSLRGKSINNYQEYKDMNITGESNYNGEVLKDGIYVRRDILDSIFCKCKAKVRLSAQEEINTKNK